MSNVVSFQQYKHKKEARMSKQEEDCFVSLFRTFINIEEPKYDLIVIEMLASNLYIILNENNQQISYNRINELHLPIEEVLLSRMLEFTSSKYVINNSELIPEYSKNIISKVFKEAVLLH